MISSTDRTEAAKALRKAGVDIIAQPPSTSGSPSFPRTGRSSVFAGSGGRLRGYLSGSAASGSFLSLLKTDVKKAGETSTPVHGETNAADSIKQKFHNVLEKTRLSDAEREELSARIERRLVLTESQLENAALRYEKLEARGLDYSGKAVIAKQAIESGSTLEVTWPGRGGTINKITGLPQTLEKKESDNILVIKVISREEGDTASVPGDVTRIPLGKISLLRRVKQSIFGG
jgi:hypothetical protein